jgi:hypothetical protein
MSEKKPLNRDVAVSIYPNAPMRTGVATGFTLDDGTHVALIARDTATLERMVKRLNGESFKAEHVRKVGLLMLDSIILDDL